MRIPKINDRLYFKDDKTGKPITAMVTSVWGGDYYNRPGFIVSYNFYKTNKIVYCKYHIEDIGKFIFYNKDDIDKTVDSYIPEKII